MSTILQLRQTLKKKPVPPIFALMGNEKALLEEALLFLKNNLIEDSSASLNYHVFSSETNDLSQVISTLNTMPFLSSRRLVQLKINDKLSPEQQQSLIDYIKNPSNHSVLILILENFNKKNKTITTLNNLNYLYTFDEVSKLDLKKFILTECKKNNLTIRDEEIEFLIHAANFELLQLKSYLDKILLLYENQEVSLDSLYSLFTSTEEQNAFLLVRAITEADLPNALLMLGKLKNQGESVLKFLGLLAWQFRTIVSIRHWLDEGLLENDIRKKLNLFGDRYLWMARIAKKKSISFHIARLTRLIKVDSAIKSVSVKEQFFYVESIIYQSSSGLTAS